MNIGDVSDFQKVENEIKSAPDYERINQDHGHGDLSAALRLYKKFLENSSNAEDLSGGKGEMEITAKEAIEIIRQYISTRGFTVKQKLPGS